jgi:hypothetical protein
MTTGSFSIFPFQNGCEHIHLESAACYLLPRNKHGASHNYPAMMRDMDIDGVNGDDVRKEDCEAVNLNKQDGWSDGWSDG